MGDYIKIIGQDEFVFGFQAHSSPILIWNTFPIKTNDIVSSMNRSGETVVTSTTSTANEVCEFTVFAPPSDGTTDLNVLDRLFREDEKLVCLASCCKMVPHDDDILSSLVSTIVEPVYSRGQHCLECRCQTPTYLTDSVQCKQGRPTQTCGSISVGTHSSPSSLITKRTIPATKVST